VIGLRAGLDTICRRLTAAWIALVQRNRAQLGALYAARAPVYAALPHQVETDGHTPEAIAEEVIRLWNQHTS